MTRDEEQALVERIRAGETAAFETLVRAHEKGVYNLALRMLGSEQDALDASQETFLRAYRALPRFRGGSKLSVWLYRVTVNVCRDMLRKAVRRRETSLDDAEDRDAPAADGSADPQRALERAELRRAIRRALAKLEPDFREALVLRDVNGLTYDEIAQITGLEPGTVKSRIFRARRKLAVLLDRDGNFFGLPASDRTARKGGGSDA